MRGFVSLLSNQCCLLCTNIIKEHFVPMANLEWIQHKNTGPFVSFSPELYVSSVVWAAIVFCLKWCVDSSRIRRQLLHWFKINLYPQLFLSHSVCVYNSRLCWFMWEACYANRMLLPAANRFSLQYVTFHYHGALSFQHLNMSCHHMINI